MPTVVPVFGQSDLPIVSGNTSQDYFFLDRSIVDMRQGANGR